MLRREWLAVVLVGACTTMSVAQAQPTKEKAVQVLREVLAALEAKDYDRAAKHFQFPAKADRSKIASELAALLTRREISKKGIDVLAAKGKWGKLADVLAAKRAQGYANRFKVPLDACYGLLLEPAEAGFYWDGARFKIIRCDDIGKLQ